VDVQQVHPGRFEVTENAGALSWFIGHLDIEVVDETNRIRH